MLIRYLPIIKLHYFMEIILVLIRQGTLPSLPNKLILSLSWNAATRETHSS